MICPSHSFFGNTLLSILSIFHMSCHQLSILLQETFMNFNQKKSGIQYTLFKFYLSDFDIVITIFLPSNTPTCLSSFSFQSMILFNSVECYSLLWICIYIYAYVYMSMHINIFLSVSCSVSTLLVCMSIFQKIFQV